MNALRLQWVAAVATLLMFSGCTVTGGVLEESDKARIGNAEVILHIPQDFIIGQIAQSTTGATTGAYGGAVGALIGSLIDAAIDAGSNTRVNSAIEPIRHALDGFEFDSKIKSWLDTGLSETQWLGARPAVVYKGDASPRDLDALFASSDADAILFVQVIYAVTADLSEILISADSFLYPNDPDFAASHGIDRHPEPEIANTGALLHKYFAVETNAVHRGRFQYGFEVTSERVAAGSRVRQAAEANAKIWSQVPSQELVSLMDQGVSEIASLITHDIDTLGGTLEKGPTTKLNFWPHRAISLTQKGNGTVYRGKKGGWAFRSNWEPAVPEAPETVEPG